MIPKKKVFRPSSVAVKSSSKNGQRLKGREFDWKTGSSTSSASSSSGGTGIVKRRPVSLTSTSPSSSTSTPSTSPLSSSTAAIDSSSTLNKSNSSVETETSYSSCSESNNKNAFAAYTATTDDKCVVKKLISDDRRLTKTNNKIEIENEFQAQEIEKENCKDDTEHERNVKIVINKESRTVVIHKRISRAPASLPSSTIVSSAGESDSSVNKSKENETCVTVETAPIGKVQTEKSTKLSDSLKNRGKIGTRNVSTKKSSTLKQTPQANESKFQFNETTTSTSTSTASQPHFTELYRDYPQNCASSVVCAENIPLRPPPYRDPPPVRPVRVSEGTSSSSNKPSPIDRNDDLTSERKQRNRRYLLSLSPTVSKLIKNSSLHLRSAGNAAISDDSSESAAYRIANELRSKGNSALHKLTVNISKLNGCKQARAKELIDSDEKAIDQANNTLSSGSSDDHGLGSDAMAEFDVEMDCDAPKTQSTETSPCDILTKPEFTSSLLQNIPVRPRKGVPHLENYCLFDPRKDFVNEKELMRRKQSLLNGDLMPFPTNIFIPPNFEKFMRDDRPIAYDTIEEIHEEEETVNYFTIDPDYIDRCGSMLQPIVETDGEDIYSADNSYGSSETMHATTASNSTTIDVTRKILSSSDESFLTNEKENVHGKQPPLPPNHLPLRKTTDAPLSDDANAGHEDDDTYDNDEPLKHSVSSPQLHGDDMNRPTDTIGVNNHMNNKCELQLPPPPIESNYVLFNPAPVPSRTIQYKIRHARPSSAHSDADSGFLSPVTPPEAIVAAAHHGMENAPSILVLQQCDSIQGFVQVSRKMKKYMKKRAEKKRKKKIP